MASTYTIAMRHVCQESQSHLKSCNRSLQARKKIQQKETVHHNMYAHRLVSVRPAYLPVIHVGVGNSLMTSIQCPSKLKKKEEEEEGGARGQKKGICKTAAHVPVRT